MSARPWRPPDRVSNIGLREARLHAHYASQWLARAARAYVAARPDDSHTNLGWDDEFDGLVTHPLKTGGRLGLQISGLTLALLDDEIRPRAFPLNGRSDRDVRGWLGDQLSSRGLDDGALDAPSPYAMPAHGIADGGTYSTTALRDELGALAAWFANADLALQSLRQMQVAQDRDASPVRCWPHHFDIATLIVLEDGDREHARSVNAGFSPGDEHFDEPYFYVSPWPYPMAEKLPDLPGIGRWHTHGFTAAVALTHNIVPAQPPQTQIEAFLRDGLDGAVAALR